MDGQKPAARDLIVRSVRAWISANRLQLREGEHRYECDVPGKPKINLTVKFNPWRVTKASPGILIVGRQQILNDLDKVVEKALRRKLPKLVNTEAGRHILLLERDQFTFPPELIFAEIERSARTFRHWIEWTKSGRSTPSFTDGVAMWVSNYRTANTCWRLCSLKMGFSRDIRGHLEYLIPCNTDSEKRPNDKVRDYSFLEQ
jgi:hypothetical protein